MAQEINSFRNLSTGGALDDDADLAFRTIDLNFLDGFRFFTNLSNFGGTDQILMNSGQNHLMIGAASDNVFIKNLKMAVLLKYYDNKNPLSYMVNPEPGVNYLAFGETEYNYQAYEDNNGNNLYDYYVNIRQKYNKYTSSTGDESYLNLAYSLAPDKVLGLKVAELKSHSSHNYASNPIGNYSSGDPSYDFQMNVSNLPDMDPTVTEYEVDMTAKGDFSTKSNMDTFLADFAYMQALGNYEFTGKYTFRYISQDHETDDYASELQNMIVQSSESESYKYKDTSKGIHNLLSAGVRRNLIPQAKRKHAGFASLGLAVGFLNMEYDQSEIHANEDYQQNSHLWISEDKLVESGTIKGMDFMFSFKTNIPLNPQTFFGTGLFYKYGFKDMIGDYRYTYSAVDTTFNILGEWNNAFKTSALSEGDVKHEASISTYSIPVGLEYWFTPNQKWAMRFGSIFTQTMQTENRSYKPTKIEPMLVENYYPNQTEPDMYISDNTYLIESSSEKSRSSHTTYSYGLGYKASENLQIDLMGIFDQSDLEVWNTSFFRNLRLAFSIAF